MDVLLHSLCELRLFLFIGYESLKEELRIVSIKPMNELYFHWNDPDDCNLSFTCCPTIKPCTLAILGSFYLLATSGRKEVFCRIWNANMTSLMSRRNCVFTQEDIVRFVWKPTFEYCVELVTRLEHGGIMLNEVERVFCDDKKLTDLQLSCESLVKSLVSCSSTEHSTFRFCTCECCTTFKIQQFFIHDTSVKISSDMGWIQTVRKQIEHYRLSKKCIECAKAILTLCDENHLNLKVAGDFSSVFVLGEKVKIGLEILLLQHFRYSSCNIVLVRYWAHITCRRIKGGGKPKGCG